MTDIGPAIYPSMREIEAIAPNGLRVVSTFSGCGGSCLGFRMAGYTTLFASEFIPAAQDTYRANHPGVHLDTRDIRQLTAEDVFSVTGLQRGELDVLEGSPPCASFSMAGKREAGWNQVKAYSDTKQRTDDLFFEYARLVQGLQPRVFVAENVKGLTIGKARGYLKEILAALRGCGYKVKCAVMDAQYFGVPQRRERLIFIGVREDLGIEPTFPKPAQKPVPLKAALPHIVKVAVRNDEYVDAECNVVPTVLQSDGVRASSTLEGASLGECLAETDISRYAIGDEWDKLKPGDRNQQLPPSRLKAYDGKDAFNFTICKPNEPVPTVTVSSPGNDIGHPFEKRKFTIPELKRICGFPDDFILTGTFAQQWERLGRAVAPPMMAAVASHIRDTILQSVRTVAG